MWPYAPRLCSGYRRQPFNHAECSSTLHDTTQPNPPPFSILPTPNNNILLLGVGTISTMGGNINVVEGGGGGGGGFKKKKKKKKK